MKLKDRTENCRDVCPATPLFRVEAEIYSWPLVLACAEFHGCLSTVWDRTRAGLVANAYAETYDLPLTPEELQSAAIELRYRHNLITADETLAWLAQRDLTLDSMEDYLLRRLVLQQIHDELDELFEALPIAPADIAKHLWDETILAGSYDDLVLPLARRAVIRDLKMVGRKKADTFRDAAWQQACTAAGISTGDDRALLLHNRRFLVEADIEEFLTLEAYYLAYTEQVATPQACERQIHLMRSNYVEIDYEIASFASHDAANEAFLCVSLDGEDLATVANRALCAYTTHKENIAAIPGALGKRLLSAPVGELMEPFQLETDGRVHLVLVQNKQEPDLSNPNVMQRLRHRLVLESLAPYLEHRVEWLRWKPEFAE